MQYASIQFLKTCKALYEFNSVISTFEMLEGYKDSQERLETCLSNINDINSYSIINNSSKILRFYLNNPWNYLEQFSTDNKYVFVMEYDVNEIGNNKIEVVNEVVTNIISENDFDSLNSSQVNFNVKSIQKTDGLSIEDAWNYLNM